MVRLRKKIYFDLGYAYISDIRHIDFQDGWIHKPAVTLY